MDEDTQKVALITGGQGKIGRATAIKLARQGWSIFLQTATDDEGTEATVDSILDAAAEESVEIRIAATQADLTDPQDRIQLVEQTLNEFGQIDLLVNAAIPRAAQSQDILELDEETFRQVLDTTTIAPVFLTQLVANEMVRLVEAGMIENPRIVTINSVSAYASSTDHASQCIARSALSMMTNLFTDRLGEYGINVYEIRVGLISTGATDTIHARYDELIEEGLTPLRRWGRPEDVARAITTIAQNELSFSTGQVINVDGGFHVRRL